METILLIEIWRYDGGNPRNVFLISDHVKLNRLDPALSASVDRGLSRGPGYQSLIGPSSQGDPPPPTP